MVERKMKITKSQLRKIIYHEIKRSLNESEEKVELPPEQYDAWKKLTKVMELIEQAMLYGLSTGKEGKHSPVEVIKLVQGIVGSPPPVQEPTQDSEEVTRLLRKLFRDEE